MDIQQIAGQFLAQLEPNAPHEMDWPTMRCRPVDVHAANIGQSLQSVLQNYHHSASPDEPIRPQIALVIYEVNGHRDALNGYFPLLSTLDASGKQAFFDFIEHIRTHPNLALRFHDAGNDVTDNAPLSLKTIVAGHIAEVFFYRPDIVARFLEQPRYINIYMNRGSYHAAGGVAGGCYDPSSRSIKLLAHRLVEGFNRATPGTAPFLHEFGHMLDAFDASTGKMRHGPGLLPGLSPDDGDIFTPDAREKFLAGRKLEQERYEQCRTGQRGEVIPVGHPYVFQNNGEFIAGYLEMFFRNPHYFYGLNPVLYDGFATLLRQDTRAAWEQDYDGYIQQNRAVYAPGAKPVPKSGLTV